MPRQSGYRVTIRGFLPADRKSLEDTAKAVKLVQQAIGDPTHRGELLDALVAVEMEVTSTTRIVNAEPVAAAIDPDKIVEAAPASNMNDTEPF